MGKIELNILIGLHRNVNDLDKKTAALAAKYNLTLSQFMVLEVLYSKGNMSVGQVRDKILSSAGTIPLIVNNLEKMNYLERLTSKEDRRVSILQLTPKGYALISKIAPENEKLIFESMQALEAAEKEQLLHLLKKMGGTLYGKNSQKKDKGKEND